MGAGAEGEVRPCAWKWEWKLKSRIENEERGLRPRSSSQQRERERNAQGERVVPVQRSIYVSSLSVKELSDNYCRWGKRELSPSTLSGISPSISPCGAVWCVVKCAGYQAREGFEFRRGLRYCAQPHCHRAEFSSRPQRPQRDHSQF